MAILSENVLLTVASALSFFSQPRMLVFGTGRDSPFLCAAAIARDLADRRCADRAAPRVVFLEHNPHWLEATRNSLQALNDQYRGSNCADDVSFGACHVEHVHYPTFLKDHVDWIGRREELVGILASQLAPAIQQRPFDVVVVDGPNGEAQDDPGRMASIAFASSALRGTSGFVFVDDIDRSVEQIYSNWLLRPYFSHEVDLAGEVRLRYYTDHDEFVHRFPGR